MTIRNQHSNHSTSGNIFNSSIAFQLSIILLFFCGISVFAAAQVQYTVNRPVMVPIAPEPITDDWSEHIPIHTAPIYWETEYEYAMATAKTASRRLLIYLYANEESEIPEALAALPIVSACRKFDTVILDDTFVRSELCRYLLLRLPMDTTITDADGSETTIYAQLGFEHMLGHPGLVVVDFEDRNKPYYGEVVGILPFLQGETPTTEQTEAFLGLPSGTLTQRTLIYAVRIHRDRPQSTNGEPAPIVMQMATEHALFQAERGILNHQNFGNRSYRAKEILGPGTPAEICAQSQSGLSLFEGAIACMRAWRHSPAHWSIAKRSHRYYGYDMVRGKNGAWYAVGFFIN